MKPLTLAALLSAVVWNSSSAQSQKPIGTAGSDPAPSARAQLMDAEGRTVGEAVLRHSPHGVVMKLTLIKIAPGVHALHIHEVGQCEGPTFESAGGHFNPTSQEHGFLNPRGPHPGDLPNIEVPTDMRYAAEYFVAGVTLDAGPRSLIDADGSAVVIHAGSDDYLTEPAGEAGKRLACGRIGR